MRGTKYATIVAACLAVFCAACFRSVTALVPQPKTSPDRTFGVEFELIMNKSESIQDRESLASSLRQRGLLVKVFEYADKNASAYWKVVRDRSVKCSPANPDCLPFELVSPVLRGEAGLSEVNRVLSTLLELGAVTSNESSGMHVHVGVDTGNLRGLKNVAMQFVKFEHAIDQLVPPSRRGTNNRYCKSIRGNHTDLSDGELNHLINQMSTVEDLQNFMSPDRYYKLNFAPLSRAAGATVEFRSYPGTANSKNASAWIRLCLRFVENSFKRQPPATLKEITSNRHKLVRLFRELVQDEYLFQHFSTKY